MLEKKERKGKQRSAEYCFVYRKIQTEWHTQLRKVIVELDNRFG